MNVVQVAEEIQKKIIELDKIRAVLIERSDIRDTAEGEYNKKYAVVLIQLKNGIAFELEGVKIENPPAASVKEIAKGICWKEKLDLDKSESMLKIAFKNIESVQSQMVALQSIYKHLDNV
jgi:hypothetical protein